MRIVTIFEKNSEPKTTARHGWRLLWKLAPLCEQYWQVTMMDLMQYSPESAASMFMDEYKMDAVVVYGSIQSLVPYLKSLHCAKVAVATDSCYMFPVKEIMDRYVECGFDLMLQRGTYDPDLEYTTPQVWWPFSADPDEFHPGTSKPRINKIGLAGSLGNGVYSRRKIAAQKLSDANMLSVCLYCHKGADPDGTYPAFLRAHVAGLTSTQMDGIPPERPGCPLPMDLPPTPRAKTFEMMASATGVLTPPFFMQENLFPEAREVCFWYRHDCTNVVRVAGEILNDSERAREVALAGHDHFLRYHTDEIRIKELYDHVERLVKGKSIERKWGI